MVGTVKVYRRWEFRYGGGYPSSDLIIINIDSVQGITHVSHFRSWLLYVMNAFIEKEWWEQNEFYVFKILAGSVTYDVMTQAWGPEWHEVPCTQHFGKFTVNTTSTSSTKGTKAWS